MTTDGQAQTGFSHVAKDQLKTIIDAFARISWPAPAQAADRLLAELGWERVRPHVARTNIPVNRDVAGILFSNGNPGEAGPLGSVYFSVTDFGNNLDTGDLWGAFRLVTQWMTEMIGVPVATEGDDIPESPTAWWDLPNGGGVKLTVFNVGMTMYLLSQRDADSERFDREHPEYTQE